MGDVSIGLIVLTGVVLLIIAFASLIAKDGDSKPQDKKSLESYYESAPENHRINMTSSNMSSTANGDDHEIKRDGDNDEATDIINIDDVDWDNDDDDDDDWDDDDDDDGISLDENPIVDKDLMLTREEYRNGKIAINKLVKLIKRMSRDAALQRAVISKAKDRDTVTGEYDSDAFYSTLQQLLAKDIIYCYEELGLETEMILHTPENQLLLCLTLALTGDTEIEDYSDFRTELLSTDPLWEALRDTHEEMYNVFRNQTDVKVTAEGVNEFQLVMLVKSVNHDEYLAELRQCLYALARTVVNVAGVNSHHEMVLESFRRREKEDEKELQEKNSSPDGSMATIEDLNGLIGLAQVKKEVMAMKNFIEVNRRREQEGMKTPPVSYHCVFTGNPGTGKTTVARIVAGIYKELGILQKGHLVETDRSGLVAEYVGQTAVKTNKVIDTALDGVLFIDEAYSLVGAGNEDFGKEAIATLVKRMEDNRDRLVVILAGYENEMQWFIESNPGLRSRFNRYIHFEDYSADELKQIFLGMLQKYDFTLQTDGEKVLTRHFEMCVFNMGKDFGNARYVRNLFERTIKAQAVRLAAQPETDKSQLAIITADDISIAIADNP